MGVILIALEVERRLEEPVAARLGTDARAVRAFDVYRAFFSKTALAAFVVWALIAAPMIELVLSSSVFQPDGVGVVFGLALLWGEIVRDVLSRLRWQRSRRAA